MIRLYDYAASANCYKVRLLLAQLHRPYERVPVDIFAGETLTHEHLARNPTGETPVLELESGEFLPESNAILLYLAEGSPFLPKEPAARAQVWRWLFFEQATILWTLAGLRFRLLTGRLDPAGDEVRRRREASEAALTVLERHLGEREFLVERYSVADIGVYGYVHVAHEAGIDMARYPAVQAWLARVAAQPDAIHDLEPYPPNARPGAGRSIYDG